MKQPERIYLREIQKQDAEFIVRWRNDLTISSEMFASKGPTLEEHLAWFEQYLHQENRREFMICLHTGDRPIGTVGLSNIDHSEGTAEYGILIGDPLFRRKGFAQEATQLIFLYGFNELRLRRIILRVFSDNVDALRLYERMGFQMEDSELVSVLKDGVQRAVVQMVAEAGSMFHED